MTTTVEITGLKGFHRILDKLGEDLPIWLGNRGANGEIGKILRRRARLYCPKWTRTLWNSIKVMPVGDRDLMVSMGEGVPYAYAQEFGFSEHPISGAISTRAGRSFADWMNYKWGIPVEFALFSGARVGKAKNTEGYIMGKALRTTSRDMVPILEKYCKKVFEGLGGS